MGLKGSILPMGGTMVSGDYLQSNDGLSQLKVEADGLNLYWLPKNGYTTGYKVWRSGLSAAADTFYCVMQADGNLCIYSGTPSSPIQLLWQSGIAPGSGQTYRAEMQDDGNFCVNVTSGIWCAGCAKKLDGQVMVQGVYGTKPALLITASASTSEVSMQEGSKQYGPGQIFEKTDLIVNNQAIGFLLMSTLTKQYLGAWPDEFSTVMVYNYINDFAVLIEVDPGESPAPSDWTGLRPIGGGDNHFNVPGDGPYKAGSNVIMYHWVRPAEPNMLWQLIYIA